MYIDFSWKVLSKLDNFMNTSYELMQFEKVKCFLSPDEIVL